MVVSPNNSSFVGLQRNLINVRNGLFESGVRKCPTRLPLVARGVWRCLSFCLLSRHGLTFRSFEFRSQGCGVHSVGVEMIYSVYLHHLKLSLFVRCASLSTRAHVRASQLEQRCGTGGELGVTARGMLSHMPLRVVVVALC